MTSGATQKETAAFLEANKYFGLDPADVFIFEQNLIPCLTDKGKMILKSKCGLARAPDGNGGLYRAVREARILEDMTKRGIEFVHMYARLARLLLALSSALSPSRVAMEYRSHHASPT
jgi:UDP-N-acetylglucosamine/UDP-N-acetylgalactosamine diphosphorylase